MALDCQLLTIALYEYLSEMMLSWQSIRARTYPYPCRIPPQITDPLTTATFTTTSIQMYYLTYITESGHFHSYQLFYISFVVRITSFHPKTEYH